MMSQIDPDRLHFGRHGHKRLVGQKMNDLLILAFQKAGKLIILPLVFLDLMSG